MSIRPTSRRAFLKTASAAAAGIAIARNGIAAKTPPCRAEKSTFGKMPDGTEIELYSLTNSNGIEVRIMTLGATMLTVKTPDRDGKADCITLYLDTLDDYVRGHPLFGSVVGRYANRIANARFTIDGTEYKLTANAGPHHIHGGNREAFHRAIWAADSMLQNNTSASVRLSHVSKDGEAGFPGTLTATTTYTLTADNRLIQSYSAKTDKPTHVNLTNHAYWNLAGAGSGDVLQHVLVLHADRYLVADKLKIPTGEIRAVKGTEMDFTAPQAIGSRIDKVEDRNYDHCYVINRNEGDLMALCAKLVDPKTGRVMEISTTQPGVQMYTAKGLSDRIKAGGKSYGPYHGVCFETQAFPDSPNKPNFPSTLLRPGREYAQTTIHRFSVQK